MELTKEQYAQAQAVIETATRYGVTVTVSVIKQLADILQYPQPAELSPAPSADRSLSCIFCHTQCDTVADLKRHSATCAHHPAVIKCADLLANPPAEWLDAVRIAIGEVWDTWGEEFWSAEIWQEKIRARLTASRSSASRLWEQ